MEENLGEYQCDFRNGRTIEKRSMIGQIIERHISYYILVSTKLLANVC